MSTRPFSRISRATRGAPVARPLFFNSTCIRGLAEVSFNVENSGCVYANKTQSRRRELADRPFHALQPITLTSKALHAVTNEMSASCFRAFIPAVTAHGQDAVTLANEKASQQGTQTSN